MSKYPPPHHLDHDKNNMIEVIKAYPLATVISVHNNEPLVTHMPLIYRDIDGKLIGHIDIYNPQTKLMRDDNEVTIIFSGPQCYISPSIYTTTQLPTWNYIKLHLKGSVKAIESKDALKESLIIMTEFLEQPDQNYVLDADNPRMDANLDYIKMFEITITNWEGKFKLSQDKNKRDIEAAKQELIRANQHNIEPFLNKVF
ncbi:FMN-binding negative transcriptional regulator [Pontimicrobium aquaticum]|uniref:FMN-binding negative transcriptional regulator n=1 Tax=Pontimicrobium aquaticum TaxID=2565367 RepID=A0A4V6WEC1_9FLAO|nr:FMN-binding negative transcriptional regulator [Pontimicrobium aquaticum]TJY37159.1 FMN-binding negative transcriptional regulator [Pontimicrobium aquaticum]